jgi:hypothetical protein
LFFKDEENEEELKCIICGEYYYIPVQINECGHIFCYHCISHAMDIKSHCPLDRQPISIFSFIFSDKHIQGDHDDQKKSDENNSNHSINNNNNEDKNVNVSDDDVCSIMKIVKNMTGGQFDTSRYKDQRARVNKIQEMLDAQVVHCFFGCEWNSEANCWEAKPHLCNVTMPRKDIPSHHKVCSFRKKVAESSNNI